MRGLIVLAVILATAFAQQNGDTTKLNPPNCGKRLPRLDPDNGNKVVGGEIADREDWGWQISLNSSGRLICGGSLVNSQWLITAAHCLYYNQNPVYYSIDLGVHDRANLEPWATTRKVSKVIVHPNYNPSQIKNDIALMKLDTPVTYSDQIVPVCVPKKEEDYANKASYATGWGSLRSGGSTVRYLYQVQMNVLSDARCKQKYSTSNSQIEVCAGDNEGKDTCQGDSGGPLVVKHDDKRWYLSGITSWGYGCGDGGVYARTSAFYDWVEDNIERN